MIKNKKKIIDDILNEIKRYQETTGNMPSAIIMNDKDVKGLLDSVKVGDTIVNYRDMYNIKFKDIKIYRSIDIDRDNFKIL
jgi:hypothetical protein